MATIALGVVGGIIASIFFVKKILGGAILPYYLVFALMGLSAGLTIGTTAAITTGYILPSENITQNFPLDPDTKVTQSGTQFEYFQNGRHTVSSTTAQVNILFTVDKPSVDITTTQTKYPYWLIGLAFDSPEYSFKIPKSLYVNTAIR